MRSNYLLVVLLFFPLAVLQLTIIPYLSFRQITPDLIIILLVYFTLQTGQLHGTILGFVFGLLFDLISGGILGSAMFAKTASGFICGYFFNENKIDQNIRTFAFLAIVFIVATFDSVIYSFFSTTDISTNLLIIFFDHGLLPGIYTAVVALPIVVFQPRRLLA